jgi:hypothetical protein
MDMDIHTITETITQANIDSKLMDRTQKEELLILTNQNIATHMDMDIHTITETNTQANIDSKLMDRSQKEELLILTNQNIGTHIDMDMDMDMDIHTITETNAQIILDQTREKKEREKKEREELLDLTKKNTLHPTIHSSNSKPTIIDSTILNKISTIHQVYKESYRNKPVTGFGDFLRGCYFLLQFCNENQLQTNVIILHPIKQFLKIKNYSLPSTIKDSIEFFTFTNDTGNVNTIYNSNKTTLDYSWFQYLNQRQNYDEQLFIYTIAFPTSSISEKHKERIRNIIEPNEEIKLYVNQTLQQMKLVKKHFQIFHIRSGDNYLIDNNYMISYDLLQKIISEIKQKIKPNVSYLLISDNNIIKKILTKQFPFLRSYFKEITHLGENLPLHRENIKNTLLDFYMMSHSNAIYGISTLSHGTGFSKWCAVTYNIPYHCTKIE